MAASGHCHRPSLPSSRNNKYTPGNLSPAVAFRGNPQNPLETLLLKCGLDGKLTMKRRFRDELGYLDAQAFPIHKYGNHGRVMFWMVHASDDPRALPLMAKAYSEIGLNKPPQPLHQDDFMNRHQSD